MRVGFLFVLQSSGLFLSGRCCPTHTLSLFKTLRFNDFFVLMLLSFATLQNFFRTGFSKKNYKNLTNTDNNNIFTKSIPIFSPKTEAIIWFYLFLFFSILYHLLTQLNIFVNLFHLFSINTGVDLNLYFMRKWYMDMYIYMHFFFYVHPKNAFHRVIKKIHL